MQACSLLVVCGLRLHGWSDRAVVGMAVAGLPDGRVISSKPTHEALVSEADCIAAQDMGAARGPAPVGDPAVPGTRGKHADPGLQIQRQP